jgi:ABC-type nickel/cobalt efflux system permease component RcnA
MDTNTLLLTAVSIGFVHTVLGPDHYLPFLLMARARRWSLQKTSLITILCGVGHVLGSVILGLLGILLGVAVGHLERVEAARGNWAAWLLIGFGVAYAVWGLRLGLRAGEHTHRHDHAGEHHHHPHHHLSSHAHLHGDPRSITPWALFIIFVLGPCEPLIPILMYPAARGEWWDLFQVTLAFGITTITTMTVIVILSTKGLMEIRLGPLERYVHAIAGLIIALSGMAIVFLGL